MPHLDLVVHFLGYAIMAGLLVRAARAIRTPRVAAFPALLGAVLTAAIFGLCIEGVQALLSYRDASLLDVTANLLGAVLGTGLMAVPLRNSQS